MSAYALILAGGRGSRLGDVRKGDLRIGGHRLIERIAGRLPDMPILVSTGPGQAPELSSGTAIADDSSAFDGPMAGILAATRHLAGRARDNVLLLTVAVDTPFLPRDFVTRMESALTGSVRAAYAAWGDEIYPTNAIYRLSALAPLLVGPAPDSPKRLQAGLEAARIDWAGLCAANPFANLNTLADLIALGQRALADEE
ncbi:molybdenum cofactor guanylyltransferase [Devosia faecipullorum]|uniref:molybdenum cofactor guanylyltransferase n=1 Tax=Devosia faecipullorum TaxID=2755039 RepID=UPI00187B3AA2|nr:molybdenum cofactor guanylyltransferase [Devosia faecipullorum]MBE7731761.1 molybdenum cofactor guanylyltransferase [Devosia faecipullorum]